MIRKCHTYLVVKLLPDTDKHIEISYLNLSTSLATCGKFKMDESLVNLYFIRSSVMPLSTP